MVLLINVVGVFILVVIAYWGANTFFRARISEALMADQNPFQKPGTDYAMTMLVLGDSTGAGVGADKPEDSVAGRLARYLEATYVENYAVAGAMTEELTYQIQKAKLPKYDVILMQVGGNDILAFHNSKKTAAKLSDVMSKLPPAKRVILMSVSNVGGAVLFPPPMRPFHTMETLAFRREFARVAHGWHALYIDLYDPFYRDPFLRNPYRYLSRDGLHPSSYGYGLWFDKLRAALESV